MTEQLSLTCVKGFPGGTSGKEPACQCRRPKETWVRSLGWEDPLEEGVAALSGILASLLAQLVKNPPAIQETPVRFLGQEDLLEKG